MKRILLFCFVLCAWLMCTARAAETELTFNLESGIYKKPQQLSIICQDHDVQVHYTLDGSAPTAASPVYTGPILLERTVGRRDPLSHITGLHLEEEYLPVKDFPSAHVVRAAALLPDGTVAATAAGTYFIGYESREQLFGDLPILSLMTDKDHLFDYETGIFMLGASFDQWDKQQTEPYEVWEVFGNFSNKGKEWERPVTVDFMMAEGESFTQDMGMRIKGAASRTAPQKSIRLIAREEYGKKNIKYPLFPGNLSQQDGTELAKYKSVTLRNGANDRNNARIRDPLISQLVKGMEVETAANRPAVCYINGEYWGLYTLNEEYSDNHLANHYGLDNENIITVKKGQVEDGTARDEARFRALQKHLATDDMTNPRKYENARRLADLKSLADYAAVTLYIGNEDGIFHYNNWMMWRTRKQEEGHPYGDGRWRMMVYDSEYSSDVYGDGNACQNNTIQQFLFDQQYGDDHPAKMITNLLANEDFRKELVLSLCDVRNLHFERNRVITLSNSMAAEYFPQTNETFRRFGPEWIVRWNMDTHLKDQLAILQLYFTGRYSAFPSHIRQSFDLNASVEITLSSADGEKGHVLVNQRNIPVTKAQKMRYFTEYPITLTAVPEDGRTFMGWETTGGIVLENPKSSETNASLTGKCTVTALFK